MSYNLEATYPEYSTEDLAVILKKHYSIKRDFLDELNDDDMEPDGGYSEVDFDEDYARIGHIKRLLRRYLATKDARPLLLLSHFIVLHNVLGEDLMLELVFLKIRQKEYLPLLKSIFIFLGVLEGQEYFCGKKIGLKLNFKTIPVHAPMLSALNELKLENRDVPRIR
jgi:hypothetical protein